MNKKQKCIVYKCKNSRSEGVFIGDLCGPCHKFITTGKGTYSQAYRNSLKLIGNLVFRFFIQKNTKNYRSTILSLDPTSRKIVSDDKQ